MENTAKTKETKLRQHKYKYMFVLMCARTTHLHVQMYVLIHAHVCMYV